ncbi:hypothetical protein DEU56DRAFT_795455 [Suillus clintonianus]|uniref:uncharacterized protein n=1 Tax=Suillus clintonianus TaxID=1904413 RepID=UPI001B87ED31|nr:uncharacterized protein DEU56DRAFT_795455 [Suillus clintonianus]KAG2141904.1 hypothetical protein DEU56DRAFT_795455 [Suillus clintonianus]
MQIHESANDLQHLIFISSMVLLAITNAQAPQIYHSLASAVITLQVGIGHSSLRSSMHVNIEIFLHGGIRHF